MADFFQQLRLRQQQQAAGSPSAPSAQQQQQQRAATLPSGSDAGQALLNMLQNRGVASQPDPPDATRPLTPKRNSSSNSADAAQRMMFNSAMPRLLKRAPHEVGATAMHVHSMLDDSKRDESPDKQTPVVVLRGTHSRFELNANSLLASPSEMTQITKIRNTSTPEDVHCIIAVTNSYLVYVLKPPARAPNQGGKIRVINQLNGARALLSAHADAVIDVVSSPSDEALFASVGSDGVVLLWRIVEPDAASDDTSELTFQQLCSIKSSRGPYANLCWHPQAPVVALSRGVTVELWDLSDVLSEPSEDDDEEEEEEEMPSVPTFTNQPADPRLTPLHGHNDVVNGVCFSPNGERLASCADDGRVCVWRWSSSQCLRDFEPDEGRPVNAVAWCRARCFSTPSSDRLLYIACDSYRNVQIWDSAVPARCSRLDLAPGCRKTTFRGMTVDGTGTFVVVPFVNQESPASTEESSSPYGFLLVHVRRRATIREERGDNEEEEDVDEVGSSNSDEVPQSWPRLDPSGCRFDLITPFRVSNLIISSFATQNPESLKQMLLEDGDCKSLQIYCVQTQAVQCYQLSLKELELVTTAPATPSRATKKTELYFDADVEGENEEDEEQEEEEAEGAITPAEVDATLNELSPTDLQDLSASPAMPQAPISDSIQNMVEMHFRRLEKRLAEESALRQRAENERTRALLESISQTVNAVIPARLEAVVNEMMHSSVVPQIGSWTTGALAEALKQTVLPNLTNATISATNTAFASTSDTIRSEIANAFQQSFAEQLLPAFAASFGSMLAQIDATLENGLKQRLNEEEARLQTLEGGVEELSKALKRIEKKIDKIRVSPSMSGVAKEAKRKDPRPEIARLLQEQKFEDAFSLALGSCDLALVVWLCEQSTTSILQSPDTLSPQVLLAIVQQLSFELATNTELKLVWLRESLMGISTRAIPPSMSAHVPAVLDGVRQALDDNEALVSAHDNLQHEARMLRFVINSVAQQFA